MRLRPATVDDAETMAGILVRAIATYAEWAGPDWRPNDEDASAAMVRERVATEGAWYAIAEVGGTPVATAGFLPARGDHGAGPPIPGLAHVNSVMVEPPYWGRGIARALMAAADGAMRERSYGRAQLWTPAGNERGRRLYARLGWTETDERLTNPEGLDMVRFEKKISSRPE